MKLRFTRMKDGYWVEPENLQKRVKRLGFSLLTTMVVFGILSGRDTEVFAPFVIYWLAYESITTALELTRKKLISLVPLLRLIAITLPVVFLFVDRFRVVDEFDFGVLMFMAVLLYFLSGAVSDAMTSISQTVFGREKTLMVAGGFILAIMFYLPDRELGGFVTALDAFSNNPNSPYNAVGIYGFWWFILIVGYMESLWTHGMGLGRIKDE